MNHERLFELINKLKTNLATEAEIQELDLLYQEFEKKPGYIDHLNEKQKETYRESLFVRIHNQINSIEGSDNGLKGNIRRLSWVRIVSAASVILCLSFLSYFYLHQSQVQFAQNTIPDITPGKNSATLTLSNGQKLILSAAVKGQLATQAGVKIIKTADGQLVYTISDRKLARENENNTLTTGRSEQYQVILPDSSHVWLNASSSLTYPSSFSLLKSREVKLTGEAYFEITKDKAHPFIVKTDKQQVLVLGTHFNINSYDDEPATKTTLLQGSIQLTSTTDHKSKVLQPGQQAVLDDSNLTVHDTIVEEAIAWKNGDFNFNGENIQSIMRQLSRWYNVEVAYQGDVKTKTFTGKISRFKNISQVLKMLGKTTVVHFKVEERRIIVTE